jgi:pyridoxal biosynthesis lyase PdxS
VVASVNSDKFHYPWCPGAKQIKEANRIVFESAAEAISAGFTLAGNCN